jgi:hypothetical protein
VSAIASFGAPPDSRAPLRLVADAGEAIVEPWFLERRPEPQRSSIDGSPRPVLVVGAKGSTRSGMLAELRNLLPAGTRFLEAQETWEVLARAADSQMVVLVDDLGELSSSSLVRLLARRQPTLPVLAVGGVTSARADAASM